MEANVIPLNIKFKKNTREVAIIPVDFWVEKIKNGENFKWVKVNHGIFDMMSRIPNIHNLNSKEIGVKMFPIRHFNNRGVPQNTYIDIIDKFISNIRNYDNIPSNYYIGVSDSNGLNIPPNQNRHKTVMGIINNNNKRTLLHGGLIRRYVVSNDIFKLLNAVKENGYKIHVIGPGHCTHYKKFLGEFTHINIPKANALGNLDKIVKQSKESLSGKDIFFTSLTTGTFLFIDKFKEENTTIIDIGRAFDYLIKDHRSVQDQPWLTPINPNDKQRYQKRLKFYGNFVKKGYDHDLIEHTIKKTYNY